VRENLAAEPGDLNAKEGGGGFLSVSLLDPA
jgi:hypothetical protein